MIIQSQCRTRLVNGENIQEIVLDYRDGYNAAMIRYKDLQGHYTTLGEYFTLESAISVLNELLCEYTNYQEMSNGSGFIPPKLYVMPEE